MNSMKFGFAIFCILFISTPLIAQDIEPRRWSPMPLKTNVVGVGYAFSYGDIMFDPVLQTEDVTVSAHNMIVSYVRPFKLFGKLARFDGNIPYVAAKWEGLLAGNYAAVDRSGFGDPKLRISLLLNGAPAGDQKALQEYIMSHPVRTIYGVSFAVRLPLGQYYEDKLLNIGQNIFIFIPQAGLVHHWSQWSFEVTASVNFYTNNNDFISGQTKEQDPSFALQANLVRNFKKGLWASAGASYGLGGRSVVNRTPNNDDRSNIQAGCSIGFPVFKSQGMKVFYIRSESLNDLGGDTNNFGLAWLIQI